VGLPPLSRASFLSSTRGGKPTFPTCDPSPSASSSQVDSLTQSDASIAWMYSFIGSG
jgi:hypothetical protein